MSQQTRTTFIPSMVSIALVLFFFGMFALIPLGGKVLVDTAKEELVLKAMLAEGTTEQQARGIIGQVKGKPYVKAMVYRSRQDAMKEFKDLGDDFVKAMDGFNPFLSSVNIKLNAQYIQEDSIRAISTQLMQNAEVVEVDYPIRLIERVNDRIGLVMNLALPLGVILATIAFLLILNTVKLAIFSKRLTIRTMQLIGATNSFIRAPFIRIGILQGFLGGVLAVLLLGGLLVLTRFQMINLDEEFQYGLDEVLYSTATQVLFISLIVFGALLGWVSSKVAVNRFLNKNLDQIA